LAGGTAYSAVARQWHVKSAHRVVAVRRARGGRPSLKACARSRSWVACGRYLSVRDGPRRRLPCSRGESAQEDRRAAGSRWLDRSRPEGGERRRWPWGGRAGLLTGERARPGGLSVVRRWPARWRHRGKARGDHSDRGRAPAGKYVDGLPDWIKAPVYPVPFIYEATGAETRFTNGYDPDARSRRVFSFHRPETLAEWSRQILETEGTPTFRARLRVMPPLDTKGLWSVPPGSGSVSTRNDSHALAIALYQPPYGCGPGSWGRRRSARRARMLRARRARSGQLVNRGSKMSANLS
jgi:hypothetical protein